jgi:hypothetical protein
LDGEQREFVLKIRRGEVPEEEVLTKAKEMVTELEPKKNLVPDKVNSTFLNEWLLRLRKTILLSEISRK